MDTQETVNIKLTEAFTGPVCDYGVGFLKFRVINRVETAEPMGTGTFVRLGKVYGILTAGHVLAKLNPRETVGLVRFPSIQPPLQNFRLNLDHTTRIVEWNDQECDAPDIAFVSIPELDGKKLEAFGAIFYNLGLVRKFKVSHPDHRMAISYAIVGVVAEWTEESFPVHLRGKKINVGGIFGAATNVRPFVEDGTDLVEVEIDYTSSPRIPKSHGGVSGGAIWELHVELDANLSPVAVNKLLYGVAFRQSADNKRVTANALASIDGMKAKILENWPNTLD